MAYLDDKIEQAYKLSQEALKSPRFDSEAFIVASVLRLMGADTPKEETHTCIDELFNDFCNNRSLDNLELLLNHISRLLCELYHSCSQEEKEVFKSNLLVCRTDM